MKTFLIHAFIITIIFALIAIFLGIGTGLSPEAKGLISVLYGALLLADAMILYLDKSVK